MVVFKDSSLHGLNNLTIVSEDGEQTTTTTLPTYLPATGILAPDYILNGPPHLKQWYTTSRGELVIPGKPDPILADAFFLESSIHSDGSDRSCLLVEQINNGYAKWTRSFFNDGEASFTSGYWEWLELILSQHYHVLSEASIYDAVYASLFTYDRSSRVVQAFCEYWCPLTNTLHLPMGELSVSLWDLREIGGLPIHGMFYDEVVPSATELLNDNRESLPSSCRSLFAAYHHIHCKQGKLPITLDAWVEFWFRGPLRYAEPPRRSYRKNNKQPRVTNNPTGIISSRRRSAQEDTVFEELGIHEDKRDEIYVAAFL